jgi:acyl carrier protein phosphodiesterase
MNYLIDIYIGHSIANKNIAMGNIIANYSKYCRQGLYNYGSETEKGILFNKQINKFILSNSNFIASKSRINKKFTRYGNEVVKIYYSHFFATNWKSLTGISLEESLDQFSDAVLKSNEEIPRKLRNAIPLLISPTGLRIIDSVGGLHQFLGQLSNKGYCVAFLQYTLQDLLTDYASFKSDWNSFMNDLDSYLYILNKREAKEIYLYQEERLFLLKNEPIVAQRKVG